MSTVLLVAAGGAAGAVLRYLIDRGIQQRGDGTFPWGTLAVNVLGCLVAAFIAGIVAGGASAPALYALVVVGLCGSLTTFSTFGYETVHLFADRARLRALANVVATLIAGFLAVATGLAVATLF
ncbi:fluoride efflux transporter CrcB [Haloechinothrix sp. LS1_15]|uniref:fluoride efflux transporter CrcB n=1 Tax=Haloechinothrix sp. LS1_15 TaxID=2652248 RepID=UPI002946B4C7|nr:fluoride efflux transporter CrcB [Haloechinothrix sp. LS1_15]MDV6013355.1 fluoride efflux transporter CrcB [Haloechinothrix sp. LS1_15]